MKISPLRIKSFQRGSQAYKAGLRPGDSIMSVDGKPVDDELDFTFYSASERMSVEISRKGNRRTVQVARRSGTSLGIDFYDQPINRCRNRCIFCFIDQMPRGLRKGLYIKDEDFKHSFLNGNYVTLTGASRSDLEKSAAIGLTPLYISVHATDRNVRRVMLRNQKAPDIMDQLRFLSSRGITFHTQIVVCPGYNDGKVLLKSIRDLFTFKENLRSVAVVPVGLTNYGNPGLTPVDRATALLTCTQVNALGDGYARSDGYRKLFCADEFFIKAGLPIPSSSYYGDYPQIENGVGLVRQLIGRWNSERRHFQKGPSFHLPVSALIVTSESAFPYVINIAHDLEKVIEGAKVHVTPVRNAFFGESVTVAGLLTAGDILRTVRAFIRQRPVAAVVLPSVIFNYAGYTLDGYSLKRIEKVLGVSCIATDSFTEIVSSLTAKKTQRILQ